MDWGLAGQQHKLKKKIFARRNGLAIPHLQESSISSAVVNRSTMSTKNFPPLVDTVWYHLQWLSWILREIDDNIQTPALRPVTACHTRMWLFWEIFPFWLKEYNHSLVFHAWPQDHWENPLLKCSQISASKSCLYFFNYFFIIFFFNIVSFFCLYQYFFYFFLIINE